MASLNKEALKRITIDGAGKRYARSLGRMQDLSREQFYDFQQRALSGTYHEALKHVTYYRNTADYPQNLPLDAFMSEFGKLPVLHKETVKQRTAEFIRQPKSPFLMSLATSGTTGSPLEIFQTPFGRVKSNGLLQSVHKIFCGLTSPRILHLSASLVGDQVTEQVSGTKHAYLSIYQLNQNNREEIEGLLREFKPELIHGFPSALTQLARLFSHGLPYQLPDNTVRCVATSETLFPDVREMIEENLGTIVHNEYGSQEGQHFAFECEHRGMHIHPARGYVEILDFETDQPALPGEAGRVVVTGFQNRHMPLIRYSLGDTASMPPANHICACGNEWPVLQDLQGRTQDLIKTKDGNRIGLIESATLRTVPGIQESQIIQTAYEAFTYRIVTTPDYNRTQAEAEINHNLSERLGYGVDVNYEYVDSIEKSSAGKHRAVVVTF